jgi:hypothetical protein
MPPAVPLIAAVAGAAVTAEVGASLTVFAIGSFYTGLGGAVFSELAGSLAGFVVSTAIDAVGSRLFAPKKTTIVQPGIMVRETIETHKIVYGTQLVSGPIVYIGTTDSSRSGTNGFVHIVIALAGHQVDSIETIYFNENPITINSSGYATSAPYWNAGTTNPQAISTSVRTTEIVTVTTAAAHGFSTGDLVVMSGESDASMDGSYIITSTPTSTTFTYPNGGPNSSGTGGTATDTTNPSNTNGYVRVKTHTGSPAQVVDPDMEAEIPGWDSTHTLSGIAYVYVRLEYSPNIFGQGIPNISAIVNGKQVYDPRTAMTVWSDNAALCVRDYLTSDYGFNCDDDEINDDYFSAAANHCDESVTLTTGGSQNRYTVNGMMDTADAPIDNLNSLVAAMAGTVTYVQGQFRGYAGVYDDTVGDLDTTMLASTVKVHTRTTRQQLFNAVQGTYIDPSLNWQPTDFPQIVNATYTADDGGTQIFKDIQLPFTNHPEAAQRIAKVILEQGRQGIMVELTLNHLALPLAVFDTVTYTDPTLGWDHKVFRIRKLTTPGIGPIQITMQEEASESYDWDSGDATVIDPAPDTNLPDPTTILAPTGVAQSSRMTTTSGGDSVWNLVLTWTLHPDAFVQANPQGIEIEYKLHADTAWRPSFFVRGSQTQADILTSSVNVAYDLRIRAVNTLGFCSNWVELDNVSIGTSGGVGATNDWGNWTTSPGPTLDWGNWTTSATAFNDWGFFT